MHACMHACAEEQHAQDRCLSVNLQALCFSWSPVQTWLSEHWMPALKLQRRIKLTQHA